MASVDDFLEELADDITAYQKENTVLKSKMKVLVDKIEEYRANEEALNMAVLSAQKLAVQIEADARSRAAAMIADADRQVKTTVGSIALDKAGLKYDTELADSEEKRLETAKAATAKFLDGVRAMCNAQLKNIDNVAAGLGTVKKDSAPKAGDDAIDDAVRSIESSASRIQADSDMKIDIGSARDAAPAARRKLDSTQPFSL